jgi:hypothetical protein
MRPRLWAYANAYESSTRRPSALKPWLANDNTTRPHSGINHQTPFKRMNSLHSFDN